MVLGSKFLKVGWNVLSELSRHFAERIQVGLWHEHGSTSDPNSVNPLSRRGLNPVKSLRSLSRPRIWRDERVRYDGFRGFCVSVRGTIFSSILRTFFDSPFFFFNLWNYFSWFSFYLFFNFVFLPRHQIFEHLADFVYSRKFRWPNVSIVWRLPRKVYFTVQLFSGE